MLQDDHLGDHQDDPTKPDEAVCREIEAAVQHQQTPGEQLEEIKEAAEESPPQPRSSTINQCVLVSVFAVLGAYLRIVLMDATPDGFVSYLSSQFVGSFILGTVFHLKRFMNPDVFVGLSVGLCGSLTTFSTWQVDIVETLVGTNSGAAIAYAWFQDQVIGLAVPLIGLASGKHAGDELSSLLNLQEYMTKPPEASTLTAIYWCAGLCCGVGVTVGAILAPGIISFSLVLAPLGALLRLALSRYLNPLSVHFFYGTFVANVLGSVIGGVLFDVMLNFKLNELGCAALWALQYGFCGSLTTVSTFVNELHTLPFIRSAYVYGVVSILTTQALLIIIMGSYVWALPENPADKDVCFSAK